MARAGRISRGDGTVLGSGSAGRTRTGPATSPDRARAKHRFSDHPEQKFRSRRGAVWIPASEETIPQQECGSLQRV